MKKFKRLSALLIASIMTAGTVSSLSAGALAHWIDKDEMDKIIENCFPVPDGSNVYGVLSPEMYISDEKIIIDESSSDYTYKIYLLNSEMTNRIVAQINTDADIKSIQSTVLEMFPNAETIEFEQSEITPSAYNIKIIPLNGYRPYTEVRENDISINDARKLYDFLNKNSTINSFNFTEYAATPGITDFGLTTYFDHSETGVYDKIEQYISENNLNWHIRQKYKKQEFKILPDNELSLKEYYNIAEQIYNDLGFSANLLIPATANLDQEFTIDMHNNIDGDANNDGELSLADAVSIMQAIGNPDEYALTPQGKFNADISGDNDGITNTDALAVQKKLLNIE